MAETANWFYFIGPIPIADIQICLVLMDSKAQPFAVIRSGLPNIWLLLFTIVGSLNNIF